jgi:hypothetical protein
MSTKWAHVVCILAFAAIGTTAKVARADGDYARFRGGIDLTAGGLLANGYGVGLVGVDGRVGVQVNHLLGLYVQPQLVFGDGSVGNINHFTGVFGVTGMADFTFGSRFFVAAGAGFTYLGTNDANAAGEIEVRLGGYPIVARNRYGARRGLMIGADIHVIFVDGVQLIEPMFAIGFEAF